MPGRGRRIYDFSGLITLEENQTVQIRRGKWKGKKGRLTHVRRNTGHVRIYVQLKNGIGTWLAPRSVDVLDS
jgi:hypothetical protein